MESVKSLLGDEEKGETTTKSLDFASSCPSLSFKQRLWGFGICFVGGFLLGVIGAFILFVNIVAFAVIYTIGNIMAISSTCFLMGPLRQIKSMFAGTRIIATLVFIGSMALTLFAAFYFTNDHTVQVILCLLFMIIQWAALIWYSLSYIPFARNVIKGCLRGICAD